MKLFTALAILLVCVSRLDADQSTTIVPPKSKVCFSYHGYFKSDESNQFQADVTSMSLFMLDDSTLSSPLHCQDKCSIPRTNRIRACVESEQERMEANLVIEVTCTQQHNNTTGNDGISKATTLTLNRAANIMGEQHSNIHPLLTAVSIGYEIICSSKDGGNSLDGIELIPYEGTG